MNYSWHPAHTASISSNGGEAHRRTYAGYTHRAQPKGEFQLLFNQISNYFAVFDGIGVEWIQFEWMNEYSYFFFMQLVGICEDWGTESGTKNYMRANCSVDFYTWCIQMKFVDRRNHVRMTHVNMHHNLNTLKNWLINQKMSLHKWLLRKFTSSFFPRRKKLHFFHKIVRCKHTANICILINWKLKSAFGLNIVRPL